MDYNEFYSKLIFNRTKIEIPILDITIDKTQFLTDKGYSLEEQEKFLKNIYNDNLDKLSKQI